VYRSRSVFVLRIAASVPVLPAAVVEIVRFVEAVDIAVGSGVESVVEVVGRKDRVGNATVAANSVRPGWQEQVFEEGHLGDGCRCLKRGSGHVRGSGGALRVVEVDEDISMKRIVVGSAEGIGDL